MKNIIALILLFLTSFGGVCQKWTESDISFEVKAIVDSLTEPNTVNLQNCTETSHKPSDYKYYIELEKLASNEELKALTYHPTPSIRAYSFYILSQKKNFDIYPLIISHFNDTGYVEIINSCVLFGFFTPCFTVSDFYIEVGTGIYDSSNQLNHSQTITIDSMLLYHNKEKHSRYYALKRHQPNEADHKRIKDIVIKDHSTEALIALARYNNPKDVQFILDNKDFGYSETIYRAISAFPHSDFFPFLKKQLKENKFGFTAKKHFYLAVAKYKNEKSKQLLNDSWDRITTENKDKYEKRDLAYALERVPNELYTDLLFKLWDNNFIGTKTYQFLQKEEPDKTYQYTLNSISDSIKLDPYKTGAYNAQTDTLIDLMLNQIELNDKPLAIKIIRQNLKPDPYPIHKTFAVHAVDIKDESFIEPLFEIVNNFSFSSSGPIAIKGLLSYENKEYNKRLIQICSKRKNTNGGNTIKQILTENGLL